MMLWILQCERSTIFFIRKAYAGSWAMEEMAAASVWPFATADATMATTAVFVAAAARTLLGMRLARFVGMRLAMLTVSSGIQLTRWGTRASFVH
jgi:hypothetical protein